MRTRLKLSQAGFTLVELMIVVAIIAVLLLLAAPSFTETIDKRRLVGAAEAVYSQLQYAKTEAVKGGRLISVTYQKTPADNSTVWCSGIREGTTACDCRLGITSTTKTALDATSECAILGDGATPILKVLSGNEFNSMTLDHNITGNMISFDPVRGTPRGTLGTITVTSLKTSRQIQIVVNPVGRIRMCSPSSNYLGGYPTC